MKQLISIVGPTAVGKSALALSLANYFATEIISCDSRQMYRGMDIGTAKPSEAELAQVAHHFIDTLDPAQAYTAGKFEEEAEKILQELFQNHDQVIMVGGSTLYAHALWHGIDDMPEVPTEIRQRIQKRFEEEGLSKLIHELAQVDPKTYEIIDRNNPARVIRALEVFHATGNPISLFRKGKKKQSSYSHTKIGLNLAREDLYKKINLRVEQMVREGLVDEVERLLDKGYDPGMPGMRSIGYVEMIDHVHGKQTLEETIAAIQQNSRRYAKRQLTWFRREKDILWFEPGTDIDKILSVLNI